MRVLVAPGCGSSGPMRGIRKQGWLPGWPLCGCGTRAPRGHEERVREG